MKSLSVTAITLLLFNACSSQVAYIKSPCPKLKTWKVEGVNNVKYEVYQESETKIKRVSENNE